MSAIRECVFRGIAEIGSVPQALFALISTESSCRTRCARKIIQRTFDGGHLWGAHAPLGSRNAPEVKTQCRRLPQTAAAPRSSRASVVRVKPRHWLCHLLLCGGAVRDASGRPGVLQETCSTCSISSLRYSPTSNPIETAGGKKCQRVVTHRRKGPRRMDHVVASCKSRKRSKHGWVTVMEPNNPSHHSQQERGRYVGRGTCA